MVNPQVIRGYRAEKAHTLDKMLSDYQNQSKVVRKDLYETLTVINRLSKPRISNSARINPGLEHVVNSGEASSREYARAVQNNIRDTNPEYVYRTNDYAISKGLLYIFKSESSSNISGINLLK